MSFSTQIFLLLCAVAYCASISDDVEHLKAVAVIFRHGERNIFQFYPTDPWQDVSYWEGGLGQLRKEGKIHHYKLGKWFRQRYDGFLSDMYSPQELRVQSTDVDRTLMSVSTHLAGLYPPKGYQLWNQLINWQPIPIRTTPLHEDIVLGDVKDCRRYNYLFELMENSTEIQGQLNHTAVKYIEKHSGKNITEFFNLLEIHDTLFVETHDMGFKLPEWTSEVYPEPLNTYSAIAFGMQAHNQDLARFKVGPLYHEILSHFYNVTANEGAYKYKIYSSHDVNVANILQSFGAYENIRPPYASAMVFELRQNPVDKKHFVNVLYKNSTDPAGAPHEISVKGCKFDCDLDEFKKLLEPITVDIPTWKEECKMEAEVGMRYQFRNDRSSWIEP